MAKRLSILFLFATLFVKSQCPQVFDYLGNLSNKPYWISCTGGAYNLNFQSPTSWGTYTISWGDGSADDVGASYTGGNVIAHTYTATVDTFVVTLMIPANTCTMVGVVVMEQAAVAGIISGVTTICSPGTITYTNNSANNSKTTKYTWNFGDTQAAVFSYTNNGQATPHMYNNGSVNCATFVTLSAQNYCNFGVASQATVSNIQVFSTDSPSITASTLFQCFPSTLFTFTNSSTENCPALNTFQRKQQWNFGKYWGNSSDSLITWSDWPPAATASINYTTVGTFSIVLMDSNFCGVKTTTVNVNILNAPSSSITVPPGALCANSTITFTNSSTTGYFYKWDFGEGGGFVSKPFGPQAYTYTNTGTYTVQLVSFVPGGGNSCSDTDKVVITILPPPTVGFAFSPTVGCTPAAVVGFTDTSVGATQWNWSYGNGQGSNAQGPGLTTYTASGIFNIALTIFGANGCSATSNQTIQIHQSPVAAFSPTIACLQSVVNFTDNSTFSMTNPIISWKWTFGDGSANSTSQNPSHTYTAGGTYGGKLVVKSAFCSDSITQNIGVTTGPVMNFSQTATSGCPDLFVGFTDQSLGGASSYWNFGVIPTATSGVNNPSFTFSNTTSSPVTYTVKLISTSLAGCKDSLSKTVTVNPKPVASFTQTPAVGCPTLNVNFNASATGTSYQYSFGDGFSGLFATPAVTHTYTNLSVTTPAVYTVNLIVSNAFGCQDSIKNTVTVNPKPVARFGVDTPACSPKILNFTNISSGASTYNWDFGNGSTSTGTNPAQQFTNTSGTNQTFSVLLVATNSFGCTDSSIVPIIIHSKPNFNITMAPDSGCSPLKVNFANITGVVNYFWQFGDGQNGSAGGVTHTYLNTQSVTTTYSVKLIASDLYGCADTSTRIVKVYGHPTAAFTADPTNAVLTNNTINFTNLSIGNFTNNWKFGDGGTSTSINPTYNYQATGTYSVILIVMNNKGCRDTSTITYITITEEAAVQMPNAFTPNTAASNGGTYGPLDINNDVFHPTIKGVLNEYSLSVYSRWGELLFDSKDVTIGWDGYYHGKLCMKDVYVWKMSYLTSDGQKVELKGDVTLLR